MAVGPLVALLGCLYLLAHLLVRFFQRTRIPDVLILSLLGILVGPVLEWVQPSDFGVIGPLASTVTLAVLLFNSGTSLKFSSLGDTAWQTTVITLSTFFLTAVLVSVTLFYLTPLPWGWAILCGAIVGGTSSAVVIPMLGASKVSEGMKTVMIMESTITDVLVIVLAFALLEGISGEGIQIGLLVGNVFLSFGVAILVGVLGGFLWLKTWDKVRKYPDTVLGTLAYAFIFYGIVELLGFSGGIAALAFGVTIANVPTMQPERGYTELNPTEKSFYNEIVFLLKTFFFLYLGISMQLTLNWMMVVALLSVVAIYYGRLWLTRFLFPRSCERGDMVLVSVMVPKGLAAAVVASVPLQQGLPYGEEIQSFVYVVVLASIVLTSLLVPMSEHGAVHGFYERFFRRYQTVPPTQEIARETQQGEEKP